MITKFIDYISNYFSKNTNPNNISNNVVIVDQKSVEQLPHDTKIVKKRNQTTRSKKNSSDNGEKIKNTKRRNKTGKDSSMIDSSSNNSTEMLSNKQTPIT
jgi:hypothetical protein